MPWEKQSTCVAPKMNIALVRGWRGKNAVCKAEGKDTTKIYLPVWWEIYCVGQPEEAQMEGGNNSCKKNQPVLQKNENCVSQRVCASKRTRKTAITNFFVPKLNTVASRSIGNF